MRIFAAFKLSYPQKVNAAALSAERLKPLGQNSSESVFCRADEREKTFGKKI
jgi:hypothetical protein